MGLADSSLVVSHTIFLILHNDDSILPSSTTDEDIVIFLKSRYGINVTAEEVRETILQGMQADADPVEDGDDKSVLDIMELTSILLIPILNKSAKLTQGRKLPKGVAEPPSELIWTVLQRILQDVLGSDYDEDNPPELTTDLLSRMFQAYGEEDLARNKNLLKKMIESCKEDDDDEDDDDTESGDGLCLDELAFAQGLTHDVQDLDIANEMRKTTGKDDVFLSHFIPANRRAKSVIGLDLEDTHIKIKQAVANDVDTEFTFAAIDLAASTYRYVRELSPNSSAPPPFFQSKPLTLDPFFSFLSRFVQVQIPHGLLVRNRIDHLLCVHQRLQQF